MHFEEYRPNTLEGEEEVKEEDIRIQNSPSPELLRKTKEAGPIRKR